MMKKSSAMKNETMRNKKRFYGFSMIAFALSVAVSGAQAELKGTYELHQAKRTLDLFYLDDNHLRANFADKQQLVLKGSQSWLLHRQGEQWLAVDADQAAAVLKATRGEQLKQPVGDVQLRDTGRKEVVAGYSGNVFELSVGDNKSEIVLTDNADVLALTNGWRTLAIKLSNSLGAEQSAQLQQALAKIPQRGMGGLLRQGSDLTLVAIDKHVEARDVEFPANTQVLPKISIPGF